MMLLGRSHIVLLIINVQASFFISQLLSVDISIQVPCCFCRCRRAPPLWSFQKLSLGPAVQLGLPEKIGLFGKNICNGKRGEGLSAASCSVNGGGIIRRSLSHCAIHCARLCEDNDRLCSLQMCDYGVGTVFLCYRFNWIFGSAPPTQIGVYYSCRTICGSQPLSLV